MMILILVIVVLGIYYFMRVNKEKNTSGTHEACCSTNKKNPEEILKERFVNGEIDEKTYLKMKDTLNK